MTEEAPPPPRPTGPSDAAAGQSARKAMAFLQSNNKQKLKLQDMSITDLGKSVKKLPTIDELQISDMGIWGGGHGAALQGGCNDRQDDWGSMLRHTQCGSRLHAVPCGKRELHDPLADFRLGVELHQHHSAPVEQSEDTETVGGVGQDEHCRRKGLDVTHPGPEQHVNQDRVNPSPAWSDQGWRGGIIHGINYGLRNVWQSMGKMPMLMWFDKFGSVRGEKGLTRVDWHLAPIWFMMADDVQTTKVMTWWRKHAPEMIEGPTKHSIQRRHASGTVL
eukprot:891110-Rhodomonas_salina.1